jgi:diadenosine tetraphosphate (Ap4A) HIT family hydrolase/predicted house-cleaning noncanonical NTP pyrophosphatase (MazG superfamily)
MKLKRFKVEKLIRDKLPKILRENGIIVHEKTLEEIEFVQELKNKLQEESEEVKHTQNQKELTEELANVLEVVYNLSNHSGISLEQIEKVRLEKKKLKGSFSNKVYCSHIEVEESNPAIERYLKKPKHYPLMDELSHKQGCLFCQFAKGEKPISIFEDFQHCFAIKDQYPVSPGHVLIIPKEHTENWFTAKEEVRMDMIKALHVLKDKLDLDYQPQGYNIGANCGEIAGQTIMHLHLHLIPRYQGDMEDPKGGVRGVIPSKQKY